MTIRDEYRELTRRRILDAAANQMRANGYADLTIAVIAETAGVTQRTVYRHFATRDDLLAAVWTHIEQCIGTPACPQTCDELIDWPRRLFPRFEEHAELVRASLHSPAGDSLRRQPNKECRDAILKTVAGALPRLSRPEVRRRAAIAQLINSAAAWESMSEYWDLEGKQAAEAASEALAILLGRENAPAAAKTRGNRNVASSARPKRAR